MAKKLIPNARQRSASSASSLLRHPSFGYVGEWHKRENNRSIETRVLKQGMMQELLTGMTRLPGTLA